MIITIDGPSGTGKSSVARALAERLDILFVDTGAMYRAFTHLVLQRGIDPNDQGAVCELLPVFEWRVEERDGYKRYWIGQEEVTQAIRFAAVTGAVSVVSAYVAVRQAMVERQRRIGSECDALFEGRDLGTVVFPNADLKIFLTARPEVRAQRRFNQIAKEHPGVTLKQILADQQRRDTYDSTREHSPLQPAADAHVVDTSALTLNEVVDRLVALIPGGRR